LAKAEEATKKQRPSRIPAAAPRVLASCFYLGFVELDAGVEREEECGSGWSGDAEGGSTGGAHCGCSRRSRGENRAVGDRLSTCQLKGVRWGPAGAA
jgi:hypothetical protein